MLDGGRPLQQTVVTFHPVLTYLLYQIGAAHSAPSTLAYFVTTIISVFCKCVAPIIYKSAIR